MSDRSCYGPVRAAVGNAFSDEDIDEMVARVADRLQTRAGKNIDAALIRDAIATETRESMRDALIAHRMKASAKVAATFRDGLMAGMPSEIRGKAFTAVDQLRAYDTGSDRLGANTGFSTEVEGKARFLIAADRIEQGVEESGGKGLLDPMFNKAGREAHENDVAIEMARAAGADLKATGNEMAEKQAKVFVDELERGRIAQNNEGAWIDKRTGYIAKQNHDALKIAGGFWAMGPEAAAKAFRTWRDFITPLLDDATFEGIDKWDFDKRLLARHKGNVRDAFLEKVWQNITTGSREGQPGVDFAHEFVAPASKARSVSKPRTLHFKDPEAWLGYHRRFGKGSLYQVIVGQVEASARNTALMHRWGPNPEAARIAHIKRTIADLRNAGGAAENATVKTLTQALDGKGQLGNEWDILTGAAGAAENLHVAKIGAAIRIDQRLSKLGGAVLASFGPDQGIAAQVFKQHGGTYLNGYMGAFKGILGLDRAQQTEVGRLMGIGSRSSLHELAGRFDAADGVEGVGARLTQFMFKATGFEYIMNGHRRGLADMWSSWAAGQSHLGFHELPADFQAQLGKFNIAAKDWDVLRANTEALGGDRFMNFKDLPDDLSLKARAYVAQFIDDSLTEPGVREQAKLTLGTRRGTLLGEAVRCFTQFKAFPLTYITRHLNPAIGGVMARESGAGGKMAHLIVAATLFGFLSMQAKQLAKGLAPRPVLDDDGHLRTDVWIASLLQGGGLGIYGDFLFGEYNRAGNKGVVETLGGPSVGEFANIVKLMSRVTRFDKYGDDTGGDIAADSFTLLKNNTPFLNTWYLKAALDHFILFNMQNAISPGYLDRYQKRLQDEQGQKFLFKTG